MAAIAVECFHKASLVHDDIEDADARRYGRPTLHVEHGVPVALNVGDLLVGEGYRLLAGAGRRRRVSSELVRIAAAGHRELCLGQGAELSWMQSPAPLTADRGARDLPPQDVAGIPGRARHRRRARRRDADTQEVLRDYSDALGIAYQIRDDLEDLTARVGRRRRIRRAVAAARRWPATRRRARPASASWRGGAAAARRPPIARRSGRAIVELDVESRARALLEAYKEQAIRTLPSLQNASLKGLLRRVIGKVFRVEIKGWCSEFEARDAAGRQAGAQAAG